MTFAELLVPPAWHADAACRDSGHALFFVNGGEPCEITRALCGGCLVAGKCAEVGAGERHGIWGGQSEQTRRRLRRRRILRQQALSACELEEPTE